MDPSLLLPNLKLITLFVLLLFITFLPFSFGYSKDDLLPTEGTQAILPFLNLLKASLNSNYTGDSFSMPDNMKLARLLNIGSLTYNNGSFSLWPNGYIPPLDGTNPGWYMWRLQHYSMKFVAYDMRLGKLQIDPSGRTFSVQLQIFVQWQEWLTSNTLESKNLNRTCAYACDNTQPMNQMCCDNVWVPTLRLPNADISRVDSILSDGNLGFYQDLLSATPDLQSSFHGTYNETPEDQKCMLGQTSGYYTGNSSCYHQRFWELSVDVTRKAHMNFQKFPFDVQQLSVEIRNPYSSRTWLQLVPGSLQQSAYNLVQEMSADVAPLGWSITDVIISPLCDAMSWKPTFLALDRHLQNIANYTSQAEDIERHLVNSCPKLYSWSPNVSTLDFINTSGYDSIIKNYSERLNYTQNKYINCVLKNGFPHEGSIGKYVDFWIDGSDPRFNNTVSLPCLVDVVQNLTTPGIKVTIPVKRYTEYYILKMIIPIVVCVGFAFTTIAIDVKDVANRLMVVVPAAIALTAVQAMVGDIDVLVASYINVPSTWLMMISYLTQLLICFESMVVYKMGYPYRVPPIPKVHFKFGQFQWTTRQIDFLLMGMLFIFYMAIVSWCLLIPVAKVHKNMLLSNGINIWNAGNNTD